MRERASGHFFVFTRAHGFRSSVMSRAEAATQRTWKVESISKVRSSFRRRCDNYVTPPHWRFELSCHFSLEFDSRIDHRALEDRIQAIIKQPASLGNFRPMVLLRPWLVALVVSLRLVTALLSNANHLFSAARANLRSLP
jgi:hypothetical protein